MFKFAKIITILSFFALLFACSRNSNSTSSISDQKNLPTNREAVHNSTVIGQGIALAENYNSEKENTHQDIFNYDPAYQRFLVPPEIAIMHATIYARGNSFSEVSQFITTHSDKLIQSISQVEGCSADILDYLPPHKTYNRKILMNDSVFSSTFVSQITISFEQANNVTDRITQLNKCLQAIPQLKLDNPEKKNTSISLELSNVVPTLKDASIYSQQLLKAKFAKLQEVANLSSEAPSQFMFEATKCTSKGLVRIGSRSLSGVELDVDFKCQQFN